MRTGNSSPFGKRTEEVRTKVAYPTKEGLERMWRDAGYANEAEYVAVILDIHVLGEDHVAKIHADRIRAVARRGRESA